MKYLLDTNTCIVYIGGRSAALRQRLLSESPSDIAVCAPVKAELFYGAAKAALRQSNGEDFMLSVEPHDIKNRVSATSISEQAHSLCNAHLMDLRIFRHAIR